MLAGKQKFFIVILRLSCFFYALNCTAQFAPGPNTPSTTAINKNNTNISFWADSSFIHRSWQNINDTTLGKTTVGTNTDVLGKANNKVVSLGDGGYAILNFPFPIYNEQGYDFAVFENGFAQTNAAENLFFLELATVSVSENGIDFIPFASTSLVDTNVQVGSFASINCTQLNNLAGKYPIDYGTPFDLDELGLDSIISIKITDVIGSINPAFATYDSNGNIINDPFPTPFASGGFDLNAVAALNQKNKTDTALAIENTLSSTNYLVYPSLVNKGDFLRIKSPFLFEEIAYIYDINGNLILKNKIKDTKTINTEKLSSGIYFINIVNDKSIFSSKFIVR